MSKFVVQVINNNTSTYIVEAEDEQGARTAFLTGEYSENNHNSYGKTNVYAAPEQVTLAAPTVTVDVPDQEVATA